MLSQSFVVLLSAVWATAAPTCNLNADLVKEIQGYQPLVDKIIDAVNGPYKNKLYDDLADFVDTYGARQSGSETLELAIDDVIERQKQANLVVSTHDVQIPKWTRGEESAEMILPRRQKLAILGLGTSPSTPPEGVTAKVVVIKNFEELETRTAEVDGNIVLFNAEYVSYGETVAYRTKGPNRASQMGAAAALVRSITYFSLNNPHTGQTEFDNETVPIPSAAISLENANFIQRLVDKGVEVTINIKMSGENHGLATSRNVIADIVGSSEPEKYVVISGHIDSWDVGQGAMDDGGGAFLAWHSLALIQALGLNPPKRTLRSILWTAEETQILGAQIYKTDRRDEIQNNWTVAFESDSGVFQSLGIIFAGSDEATCIMQEIASLFSALNATQIKQQTSAGSDIAEFADLGLPMGEPYMIPNNYFYYHHSESDWMDALKTEDLDQNLAIFASTTYILADLSIALPKTNSSPAVLPSSYLSVFIAALISSLISRRLH